MYNINKIRTMYQSGNTKPPSNPVNDIVHKYKNNGWNALNKNEQEWYRQNYENILPLDEEGNAYAGNVLPVVEYYPTKRRPSLMEYSNFANDVGSGIASTVGQSLNNVGQVLGTPAAALAEGINVVSGKGFNPRQILPDMFNPSSTMYGGKQTQSQVSKSLGIENPYAAMAVDAVVDPSMLLGVGKTLPKLIKNRTHDIPTVSRGVLPSKNLLLSDKSINNKSSVDLQELIYDKRIVNNLNEVDNLTPSQFENTYYSPSGQIVIPPNVSGKIPYDYKIRKGEIPSSKYYSDMIDREGVLDEIGKLDPKAQNRVRNLDIQYDENKGVLNFINKSEDDGLVYDYYENAAGLFEKPNYSKYIKRSTNPHDFHNNPNVRKQVIQHPVYNEHIASFKVSPGYFKGEVGNYHSPDYIDQFPGLEVIEGNSNILNKEGKFLEGVNNYLKKNNLGRVKSNTYYSPNLNEQIKKSKAVGYEIQDANNYNLPRITKGMLKQIIPATGIGLGAYGASQQRNEYQDGGYTLPEVTVRPDNRNQQLILKNMHKPMVKRMFNDNPLTYTHPGNTAPSTHSMGWSGGKTANYVYPTLIQDGDKLRPITGPRETMNNEFVLPYDEYTNEEADRFSSEGYKQGADDLRSWFGGKPFNGFQDSPRENKRSGGRYTRPRFNSNTSNRWG